LGLGRVEDGVGGRDCIGGGDVKGMRKPEEITLRTQRSLEMRSQAFWKSCRRPPTWKLSEDGGPSDVSGCENPCEKGYWKKDGGDFRLRKNPLC